jgi:hypothetical protein
MDSVLIRGNTIDSRLRLTDVRYLDAVVTILLSQ